MPSKLPDDVTSPNPTKEAHRWASSKKRGQIWWVRYYRDGGRHEESSHRDKLENAARLLKVREGDVARGLPVTPKIGRLRFDEAADDVLNDYRVNGKRSLDIRTARTCDGIAVAPRWRPGHGTRV